MIAPIEYIGHSVKILDQTGLPETVSYLNCHTPMDIYTAIQKLQVRGAPLIGIAAAFGLVLALQPFEKSDRIIPGIFDHALELLFSARPTAVNLAWALARMRVVYESHLSLPPARLVSRLREEAEAILAEDVLINQKIGAWGKTLFTSQPQNLMTICNAGALATGGYGTALGVIRALQAEGRIERVWALETRPVLQGSRLTVWELMQEKIAVTLITDNMAATVMRSFEIDAVIVGADRITLNGDTANKIGTYGLAVLAAYHRIPFYVAAPQSTFDCALTEGSMIPIEERDVDEVRRVGNTWLAPKTAQVYNPAFDVTPHELITGIITENGILNF